jgi:hypothetical protein
MARSMSKRTAFGKTTYKIDGREVPKEEYEKSVNECNGCLGNT